MRSGGEPHVPVQPGDLSEMGFFREAWDSGTRALPTAGTSACKSLHLSGLQVPRL